MSITSFRERVENGPGCRILVGLIMVFIAASFIFTGNSCGANNPNENQRVPTAAVATVAGTPVSESTIFLTVEGQKQNIIQQMGTYPPAMEAQNLAGSVYGEIERGLLIELAKRKGITLDEGTIKSTLEADWTQRMEGAKAQLVAMGKIKPESSAADFDKAYKESFGKSPADEKAEQDRLVEQYLKDPARLPVLQGGTANRALVMKLQKDLAPTDEALKKSYTTTVMKRVFLEADKNKGQDLVKKLTEIRADITSGKMTFEQAMNRYSNDTPAVKKTVSESTFELDGRTLTVDPDYAPIQKLKVGEITEPLTFNNGAGIFKMLSTKSELPADFETKKEDYRKQYSEALAARALQDELKKLRSENLIVWKNDAMKVLYEWYQTKADPTMVPKTPAERSAMYEKLIASAKEAYASAKDSPSAAAFAWYGIDTDYDSTLDAGAKSKRADARIEILTAVLNFTESTALRLELAGLLLEKKDKTGLGEQLKAAAIANQDFGAGGQKDFSDIAGYVEKASGAGLLDPALKKEIEEIQNAWKTQKLEKDKFEAEEKAKMDAERKKAEAEEKARLAKEKAAKPVDREKK